ncbi:hypothetical protein BOTBODRAFT_25870 [Botryobasidium botryosum FD-172 SS1]|uniref:Homeobox domain-containing protein n=1 Tax=Botryobasidium botryosum (strain FD-172 SS1) TaxID=930990 RepID=A0A067N0Q6_BOTB1|nr:hypothetical protein BOTBODRAFT_25870 [Botryobasidium botryosum FD-172 SS1]
MTEQDWHTDQIQDRSVRRRTSSPYANDPADRARSRIVLPPLTASPRAPANNASSVRSTTMYSASYPSDLSSQYSSPSPYQASLIPNMPISSRYVESPPSYGWDTVPVDTSPAPSSASYWPSAGVQGQQVSLSTSSSAYDCTYPLPSSYPTNIPGSPNYPRNSISDSRRLPPLSPSRTATTYVPPHSPPPASRASINSIPSERGSDRYLPPPYSHNQSYPGSNNPIIVPVGTPESWQRSGSVGPVQSISYGPDRTRSISMLSHSHSPNTVYNSVPPTPLQTTHHRSGSTMTDGAPPTELKPKRRRADAMQLRALNETYQRTAFPTTEERADLARRLSMSARQVQIWFQNKRQSSKQNRLAVAQHQSLTHAPLPPDTGSSSSALARNSMLQATAGSLGMHRHHHYLSDQRSGGS